jgi:hemerythrin-like domain-containing protein
MRGPSADPHLMRRATDNLTSDHALVERGLVALASIAREVRTGAGFPAADCALVLRFLREFVIGVHLHKESSIVWPALAMHGSEELAMAVGDVIRLHEEVVELAHSLVLFWEPVGKLSPEERQGFADTADAVIVRLTRLREREERDLFPAVDAVVPADDRLDWNEQFERIERERSSRGSWTTWLGPLAARRPN